MIKEFFTTDEYLMQTLRMGAFNYFKMKKEICGDCWDNCNERERDKKIRVRRDVKRLGNIYFCEYFSRKR